MNKKTKSKVAKKTAKKKNGWLIEGYQKNHYVNGKLHREDGPAVLFPVNDVIDEDDVYNNEDFDIDDNACTGDYYLNGNFFCYKNPWKEAVAKLKAEAKKVIVKKSKAKKSTAVTKKKKPKVKNGWIKDYTGTKRHYLNNKLHNDKGHACEDAYGTKAWYKNGKMHREDGPAYIYGYGTSYYYLNNEILSKSAWEEKVASLKEKKAFKSKAETKDILITENTNGWVTNKNKTKSHYVNGKLHNEIGYAVKYSNGNEGYYLNNVCYTFDSWKATVAKLKMKQGWIVKGDAKYHYVDDKIHRDDGPAIIHNNGEKTWYKNDQLHREDGPAHEGAYGSKEWWLDDIKYSEKQWKKKLNLFTLKNGWIEDSSGNKRHYVNDKLHCDDGPAILFNDGSKMWYRHGKLHREDGPAIDWDNEHVEYWYNGSNYSEADWKAKIEKKELMAKSKVKNGWVKTNGEKIHYVNDVIHHDTTHAKESSDYSGLVKYWYKHGKIHREDGPAIRYSDGYDHYYLNDHEYSSKNSWQRAVVRLKEKQKSDKLDRVYTHIGVITDNIAASNEFHVKQENSTISTLKTDVANASWRVVAKQIPKATRAALISFMEEKKLKKAWIKAASEMIETEEGCASISLILGWAVKTIPMFKDNETVQKLSEEWRVDALSTFGDSLFKELFTQISPMMSMMKSLSTSSSSLRIESFTESKAEDQDEEDVAELQERMSL